MSTLEEARNRTTDTEGGAITDQNLLLVLKNLYAGAQRRLAKQRGVTLPSGGNNTSSQGNANSR